MDTTVNGIKSYPLQLAKDIEAFIERVTKTRLTETTKAELDAIQVTALFLHERLHG